MNRQGNFFEWRGRVAWFPNRAFYSSAVRKPRILLISGSAPDSYRGAAPVWEPMVGKILKMSVYYSIDDFK